MKKNNSVFFPHYLTVISALLLILSSPVWGQGYLVWIALCPLIWVIKQSSSYRQVLKETFYHQLIFSWGIFFWVPKSFQNLWSDSNLLINTGVFLFLIMIVELQIIFWGMSRKFLENKNIPLFLLIISSALSYTFFDIITLKFFKDTLAHALYEHYSIKQLVPFIGVYGLTSIIMVVNELFFYAIDKKKIKYAILTISVLFGTYGLGYGLLASSKDNSGNKMSITIIQPNFEHNYLKGNPQKKIIIAKEIIKYIDESLALYPNTKILLLPETVYPINYYDPDSAEEQSLNLELQRIVLEKNIDLFFGTSKHGIDKKITNVYVHIYKNSKNEIQDNFFTKVKLFPFGEEIPLQKQFPILNKIFPIPSVALAGKEPGVGNLDNIPFGVAICYETITSEISEVLGSKNMKIMFNPTNESLFSSLGEPQLALALTSFRAIEQGVPIVRVGTTGISAYIDAQGRIQDRTNLNEFVIRHYDVSVSK